MKKFKTKITDIETEADAAIVFADFTAAFTKQDVYDEAEAYVKKRAPNGMSVYSFRHMDTGLMGLVLGLMVSSSTDSFICKASVWLDGELMKHYGFTSESIPPRMLVREAIATRIRYNSVVADLERELNDPDRIGGVSSRVDCTAGDLVSPEEAYTLPDADVDRIIRGV